MPLIALALTLMTPFSVQSQMPTVRPPAPIGPIPTARQLKWQNLEIYAFCHFGPNTFDNREWGLGTESNDLFQPKALDCDQWAKTLKDAGFTGMILTAKHHDGFCLWPTQWTTHSVASDSWMDGKGDVVKSASDAAHKYGLNFGVYLSPWDRNQPHYGTDEYNKIYAAQLTELCSHYGPLFEVWFDGANGEGPNGKHQVYNWDLFRGVVRQLQPQASMFGDGGPDCRWVGNENGYADATNWATINTKGMVPGTSKTQFLPTGEMNGAQYVPAECDVSIRPGWFYHKSEDSQVKTVAHLMNIWYRSVGRGCNLILNIPPDQDGLFSPADVARLMEFKKARDAEFAHRVRPTSISASVDRGAGYEAWRVDKDGKDGYWSAPDGVRKGSITLEFGKSVAFNRVKLKENIALGQRVAQFALYVKTATGWQPIRPDATTTIGVRRYLRFPTVQGSAIRMEILKSRACPTISCFQVFRAPDTFSVGEN